MTNEEVTRFALQLSQVERIRAQIAEDEAAADANGGHESPLLVAPSAMDRRQPSVSAVVAA
jgi:hypothetical protein